jgi:flagellar FliL protein
MEFGSPEGEKRFQERSARFTDALLQLLGTKEFDDLTSVQGRYLLRTEIQDLVNKVLDEPLVLNVLFTEFLAQ